MADDMAEVIPFERFELRFAPRAWPYADAHRAAIDAHFAGKRRAKPQLWNGRVLLAHELDVRDGVCRGAFFETDFASFDAWRDWGYPAAAAWDCFGAAALRGADGAYLLGVMAASTANAGRIYFPCGTPDGDDIVAGRIDIEGSARRELAEETGLDFDAMRGETGWYAVLAGAIAMQVKVLEAAEPAAALRQRILGHLAAQPQPELADVRIVRGPDDLDALMPPFIVAFLRHMWR